MPRTRQEIQRGAKTETGGPPLLRRINQRTILATLRGSGPMRLGQLAAGSGLSRPTVSHVLAELHAAGWIEYLDEHPAGRGGLGRPARLVRFKATAGYVMGIDLGARRTSIIVADLDGKPAATIRRPTRAAGDERESAIPVQQAVQDSLELSGVPRSRILSVAVGCPGVVDRETGAVMLAPGLTGRTAFNSARRLRGSFQCPVLVENDVNLAVLGERWRGTARDVRSLVFVLWDEHVGAGICVDGRLHRGASHAAGEIGYLTVLPGDGPASNGRGPFEDQVSAGAITDLARRQAREHGGILRRALEAAGALQLAEVFAAARTGDRVAREVVEIACDRLARGLAPILLIMDPDALVIGGAVSQAGQIVLDTVRRRLRPLTLIEARLELSSLGDDAVVMGGLRVALTDVEERLLHGAAAP